MATINQITVNSTTYDLAVSAANVSGTVANATTATKLGTATKGSATQPIYLNAGTPTACTYSLAKSVPADAKFTDTTYSTFVKSGSSAAAGLVPKPSTTAGTTKYLREDGTWQVPPDTNTTYSNMTAATSSAAGKAGLVPAPAAGAQAKFLRGDGTWQTPTNTTYSAATTSAAGLMSAADKTKLDGIATGANKYTLPTASSTLGGVKTTSTVTSTSGLTACPIISGVPYYKDTNTTYTLSNITGTLAIAKGGTGATTAAGAITNLGAMDLTSAQTASGVKTFSNGIKVGNATLSYDSTNKRMVISVS